MLLHLLLHVRGVVVLAVMFAVIVVVAVAVMFVVVVLYPSLSRRRLLRPEETLGVKRKALVGPFSFEGDISEGARCLIRDGTKL